MEIRGQDYIKMRNGDGLAYDFNWDLNAGRGFQFIINGGQECPLSFGRL